MLKGLTTEDMRKFILTYVSMALTFCVFWIFDGDFNFLIFSMTCVIAGLFFTCFDYFLKKLQELSNKMEDKE